MLERLKEYRDKFEQEKREIEQANVDEWVASMLIAYEAEIRADYEKRRAASIAEKDNEIKVLDKLIALETEKIILEEAKDDGNSFQSGELQVETDYDTTTDTNSTAGENLVDSAEICV